jgi:transcriptional regulator with XRE-family HTH domain
MFCFDAAKLRRLREQADMSICQLSIDTGLSHASIDCYEREKSPPSTSALLKLCTALGCQPGDLFRPVDKIPA